MIYISTRGDKRSRSFSQAVLEGLADDGGLLVPDQLPDLSRQWPQWSGMAYADLAFEVLRPLAPDFDTKLLRRCCHSAYGPGYLGPVAPLRTVGPYSVLELIHGPTLAFKDVALQLLGQLFGVILAKENKELNIVAATSGDTGSAAIYGLKQVPGVRLFVTHPDGRIAPLQRRQMTTVLDDSVFNIAVAGSFDDCQQMVKELSSDLDYKNRYNIGAVNSINFARIAAQIVYYFAAYLQTPGASRGVPAVVAVPTGNFGNILAAEYARRMGLPLAGLVLASNQNDILPTFFNTGVYRRGEAKVTHSPAMDIQVASNFERYLYLLNGGDGARVQKLMADFSGEGALTLEAPALEGFRAYACSNEQTLSTVRSVWERYETLLDPHTATAWWAMEEASQHYDPEFARLVVATAHPAKFPDVLKETVPPDTAGLLHPRLQELAAKPERLFHLEARTQALKTFVSAGVKKGSGGVFRAIEENAARHG